MLSFFGSIYGRITDLRNRLYDRGVFNAVDLGARTISIGNITAGGTGKTPLVAYVTDALAARGQRICILTRGYGRKDPKQRILVSDGEQILAGPFDAGDEPFELAQDLLGKAIVIADADRVGAGEWAKRRFGVTTFVLDDGFQHRKVKRDLDIVCIDATDPFGGGKMLPAGRLREPLANIERADVVVITRANLHNDISDLRSEISNLNPEAAIFTAKNEIVKIRSLEDFHAKTQGARSLEKALADGSDAFETSIKRKSAFAFCGIGNPGNFFEQLRQDAFAVAGTATFRDHHVYVQQDIINIEKHARASGADILLTTGKDAVKLMDLDFEMPCLVAEIAMTIDDAAGFRSML